MKKQTMVHFISLFNLNLVILPDKQYVIIYIKVNKAKTIKHII